jgi:hypothetical protein
MFLNPSIQRYKPRFSALQMATVFPAPHSRAEDDFDDEEFDDDLDDLDDEDDDDLDDLDDDAEHQWEEVEDEDLEDEELEELDDLDDEDDDWDDDEFGDEELSFHRGIFFDPPWLDAKNLRT